MQVLFNSVSESPQSWSFKNYVQHYSTGYTQGKSCNTTCWQQHICSIKCVDLDSFDKCLKDQSMVNADLPILKSSGNNTTEIPMVPVCPAWNHKCKQHHPHHRQRPAPCYIYPVIYGLAGLVFVLFFVVTVLCCCWPGRRVIFLTQPRLAFVKAWEYEPISS